MWPIYGNYQLHHYSNGLTHLSSGLRIGPLGISTTRLSSLFMLAQPPLFMRGDVEYAPCNFFISDSPTQHSVLAQLHTQHVLDSVPPQEGGWVSSMPIEQLSMPRHACFKLYNYMHAAIGHALISAG